MKLPKKVLIVGKTYTVRRERTKGEGYGRGDSSKRIITIGSKNGDSVTCFETFVHEIVELCMLENGYRFNRDTNDEFIYMVNHHELDRLTMDVATGLRPMIKD